MAEETAKTAPGRAMLDTRDARLPLHARLRDVLLARIESGDWTPRRALPAETSLARYYGVALGTVRRVLGELVEEGLLERRHGAGTFVRRAKLDRSLMRCFRHGGDDPTAPASRVLTFDNAGMHPDAARALGVAPRSPALHLHRIRLREEEPLMVEDIWLPLPRFAALANLHQDDLGEPLYPAYEHHCGIVIARAREILTVGVANAGDALLLRCRRGSPLAIIERTARTHDNAAAEWRRARGRAADFRYRVEIR